MIREEYYGESMPQLPASYFCEHADFASLKLSDAGSAFKSNKHLRSRSMKRTELSKDRTRG